MALQIAMCLALLAASSLTVRSLLNYERQDLGMQAENLLVFDVNPQSVSSDAQAILFYDRLLDRIHALPGVQAASLSAGGLALVGLTRRALLSTGSSPVKLPARVRKFTTATWVLDSFRPRASPCCKVAALPTRIQRKVPRSW